MSRHKLIEILTTTLFLAENRRLNATIIALNQRNKRLCDVKVDGFLYVGQLYMPTGVSTTIADRTQAKTPLHLELHGAMDAYLKDQNAVREERDFIAQMLFTLLNSCRTEQQIRNALPECLVDCLPGLTQLPRSEEAAYTIQDNPRALRQFQKILPKMEIYSAARLLY